MFYGGIVFPMIMVVGLFVINVIVYRIMFCFVFTFNSLSHCEVISIWSSDCVDIGPVMVSF